MTDPERTFPEDLIAHTRAAMRTALVQLVYSTGEAKIDPQAMRAMFPGKKAAKKWAREVGFTIERDDGAAIFKKAA